jgi:hypothetical protein
MSSPLTPGTPEEIRTWIAEIHGTDYLAYQSHEQGQSDPDAAIIMSGDYGGTIFLTAPANQVLCDTDSLVTLVSDLDAVTWMSGDLTIATLVFERHPIGTHVSGGDGGGFVINGIWTHPVRLTSAIRAQAEDVVLGRRTRIEGSLLRMERKAEKNESANAERAHRILEICHGTSIYRPPQSRFQRSSSPQEDAELGSDLRRLTAESSRDPSLPVR